MRTTQSASPSPYRGPSARVLILEDEPKIGLSVKKGLEHYGFSADWCEDSERGLALLLSPEKNAYDLVLLDLMMPKADGWTITRTMRAAGITTPILVMSARGETAIKTQLLYMGADDFLEKPFAFDELLARSAALIRRPDEMLPPKLSVRDIELDAVHGTVHIAGREVSLTPREFAILEYFMRRPNETISRVVLLEHAFPREAGSSNALDVHMKNLRQKLGEDLFATVRGVGYRLDS